MICKKAAIEEALQDSSQEETYIYSPMERIPIIYCSILSKEKPIYIETVNWNIVMLAETQFFK